MFTADLYIMLVRQRCRRHRPVRNGGLLRPFSGGLRRLQKDLPASVHPRGGAATARGNPAPTGMPTWAAARSSEAEGRAHQRSGHEASRRYNDLPLRAAQRAGRRSRSAANRNPMATAPGGASTVITDAVSMAPIKRFTSRSWVHMPLVPATVRPNPARTALVRSCDGH